MDGETLRDGPFHLARGTRFSYRCNRCMHCCRAKRIPVNPYEIARLAEHLGLSTTEVLTRHTETGGAILRQDEHHACVFLGESGCTVHPARPLACRLYPLGRQRLPSGEERFAALPPDPETAGVYGEDGTVGDFLRDQDIERHVAAADAYGVALGRMLWALSKREDASDVSGEALAAVTQAPATGEENLLDLDATVARSCAERGRPVPADVEARTSLHIAAIEAFVAAL
jgi:uncharacterized protein